jgi:hypothetical protein
MAAGNLLCSFDPQANQPPAAAYATPDVRNGLLVLDFDPAADESAIFVSRLPPTYGGGGLTIKIRWMASTATTGTTRWLAAIERHQRGSDDSDADSFAAGGGAGSVAAAICGSEVETTIALTAGAQMDNLAVGERFRLKITRDADQSTGTDDMAGDAELVQVDVLET